MDVVFLIYLTPSKVFFAEVNCLSACFLRSVLLIIEPTQFTDYNGTVLLYLFDLMMDLGKKITNPTMKKCIFKSVRFEMQLCSQNSYFIFSPFFYRTAGGNVGCKIYRLNCH